eukprot:scaffold2448_cov155-Amphora_coffeaeformis.AAC.7
MPGPKMGPRPADFDEELIRQSPTFKRWQSLGEGEKLKYACREFIKGHQDDEERLMRRIMIARRNNVRDHETLKKARKMQKRPPEERRRKAALVLSDHTVEREMDVAAVEATRSYRRWMNLREGEEFVYNQRYIKGRDGHEWLLKKNIWRRMRYRRENKRMVDRLKTTDPPDPHNPQMSHHGNAPGTGNLPNDIHRHLQFVSHQVQHPGLTDREHRDLLSTVEAATASSAEEAAAAAAAAAAVDHFADQAAIEAAVAAAEHFGKTDGSSRHDVDHVVQEPTHHHHNDGTNDNGLMVHDPLQAAAAQAALDAAARLAHISHPGNGLHDDSDHHHHDDDEDDVDDVTKHIFMGDDDDEDGVGGSVLV